MDRTRYFDPEERAREKQASRDQDDRDLASGAKTREQLCRENSFLRPDDGWHIVWEKCGRLS